MSMYPSTGKELKRGSIILGHPEEHVPVCTRMITTSTTWRDIITFHRKQSTYTKNVVKICSSLIKRMINWISRTKIVLLGVRHFLRGPQLYVQKSFARRVLSFCFDHLSYYILSWTPQKGRGVKIVIAPPWFWSKIYYSHIISSKIYYSQAT